MVIIPHVMNTICPSAFAIADMNYEFYVKSMDSEIWQ